MSTCMQQKNQKTIKIKCEIIDFNHTQSQISICVLVWESNTY